MKPVLAVPQFLLEQGIDAVFPVLPKLFQDIQDVKVGRYAKVVMTPTLAVKLQKVFFKSGTLHTVEWRGGTTVCLKAIQEIVSAKAFGNMGVGPKVFGVFLIKHIPSQLEADNKPEYQGRKLCKDNCWNLAIVMQRMAGSIRIAQHLPPGQRAFFWRRLNIGRVLQVLKVLSSLGYDHNDIRHDNIGYVVSGDPVPTVNLYLMDYGYGRLLKHNDPNFTMKMCEAFCNALESVGAPSIVRQTIARELTQT